MFKRFCQSLGLSSLVLVKNYGEILGGGRDVRMHSPLPLLGICIAQVLDIILLALGFFAILGPISRTRFYPWLRLLIMILVPPYLMSRAQTIYPFHASNAWIEGIAMLWIASVIYLRIAVPELYHWSLRPISTITVFFAAFALCSIFQILWVAHWKPGPQQYAASWSSEPQPHRKHPLLVWIVFDELSYDQTFEHRAPGLAMPNFDDLRSRAVLFTQVRPAGYKTVKIIPTLLTGIPVDDFRFGYNNALTVHLQAKNAWRPLHGEDTVFGDAQKAGWRTAIVGWYNPYCTTYSDAVDDCYWSNWDSIDGPMSLHNRIWLNTVRPLEQLNRELWSTSDASRDLCSCDVQQRHQTHADLQDHAFRLLRSDQADFIFLHYPIPHSPNIWSRTNDGYTNVCGSSYADNLALVDRELGSILSILRASPRWNDTTLIVEGDHSWRINEWNNLPSWTPQDELAARHTFDPRPALLVHQAGQTRAEVYAEAWPLIQIHQVVEQVLHHQAAHY